MQADAKAGSVMAHSRKVWRCGDRRTVGTVYMAKQAGDTLAIWEIEHVQSLKGQMLRGIGGSDYYCCSEFFYYRGDWAHNNGRYREVRSPAAILDWLKTNQFRKVSDKRRQEMVRDMLSPIKRTA
jgi:hypothetical protein